MKSFIAILLSAVVLVACPAPSGGEDGGTNNNNDAGTDQCASFDTAHKQFLNAAVTSDVTVIKKTPAHPPLDGGALP